MRELILALAVVSGAAAAIAGPLLAAFLAGWGLWLRDESTMAVAGVVSIALGVAAIGMGLGAALIWAGWSAVNAATSGPFRLGRWWMWLAALVVVLAAGQGALLTADLAGPLLPLLQVAAAVLPPFLFLALTLNGAGVRATGVTARRALSSMAWGGLLSAGLSVVIELGMVGAALAKLLIALQLFDPARALALWTWIQDAALTAGPADPAQLADLVPTPVFALGVLGLLGVAGPLVEELIKGAAVPLIVAAGGRPGRLSGFLLGVAAGTGFALAEGIINGSLALRLDGLWAGLMIFRGTAAAMHALASGLMGLGWQIALIERQRLKGIGLGLAAFGLHGAWNISVGIIGLNSMRIVEAGSAAALARLGVSSILALFLMFLAMAVVVGIGLIPLYLRDEEGQ